MLALSVVSNSALLLPDEVTKTEMFRGLGFLSDLIQDAFGLKEEGKKTHITRGAGRLALLLSSPPHRHPFGLKKGLNVTIFGHELHASPALNHTVQTRSQLPSRCRGGGARARAEIGRAHV